MFIVWKRYWKLDSSAKFKTSTDQKDDFFYVQHAYVGKSNDDEDDSKDVLAIFRISGK